MSMTNLTTSSSNDNEYIKKSLLRFLQGDISITNLQELLGHQIEIHFQSVSIRSVVFHDLPDDNIDIAVSAVHVQNMLQKYINGLISDVDLSNWATLIVAVGAYVPEGDTEDERWYAGEGPVWDVLQRLTTPTVFDSISTQVAQMYYEMLVNST